MKDKDTISGLLEKPNFTDIELAISKSRNKLIGMSFLAIFISKYKVNLDDDLKFLEIKIENITVFDISVVLSIVIIYLLISLVWASWSRWLEWNIRRTGMNKYATVVKGMGFSGFDYPDDYKQSTLYTYWGAKKRDIEDLEQYFLELKKNNLENINFDEVNKRIIALKEILYDTRIELSLKRFDESFFKKINIENWRSLVFDLIIPVVFSISSLLYLFNKNIF